MKVKTEGATVPGRVRMTEELIRIIGKQVPLKEKDCGEFSAMKVGPMYFKVRRFEAEGFGRVSVMEARGLLGLMKMDTIVVGPRNTDAPFLSYDFISAMGKLTLMLELYDSTIHGCPMDGLDRYREELKDCEDHVSAPQWYDPILLPQTVRKEGSRKEKALFEDVTRRYFADYMELAKAAPACDPEEKNGKISEYVEGLLANGGPAVNQFKKQFGPEKTGEVLRKVLFGTEE